VTGARASGASGHRLLCEDKRVCVTEGRRVCVGGRVKWSGVDRLAQEVFTWGRIEELGVEFCSS
jgi:hypothetical protein